MCLPLRLEVPLIQGIYTCTIPKLYCVDWCKYVVLRVFSVPTPSQPTLHCPHLPSPHIIPHADNRPIISVFFEIYCDSNPL